jgi:hypothetical protein
MRHLYQNIKVKIQKMVTSEPGLNSSCVLILMVGIQKRYK